MQDKVEEELERIKNWDLPDKLDLLEGLTALIRQQIEQETHWSTLELEAMEQVLLAEELVETVRQIIPKQPRRIEGPQPLAAKEDFESLYDVREFRNIGHGTWIDAGGVDAFIKQERSSR